MYDKRNYRSRRLALTRHESVNEHLRPANHQLEALEYEHALPGLELEHLVNK